MGLLGQVRRVSCQCWATGSWQAGDTWPCRQSARPPKKAVPWLPGLLQAVPAHSPVARVRSSLCGELQAGPTDCRPFFFFSIHWLLSAPQVHTGQNLGMMALGGGGLYSHRFFLGGPGWRRVTGPPAVESVPLAELSDVPTVSGLQNVEGKEPWKRLPASW